MSQEKVEFVRRLYDRWEQDRTINPDDFHAEFEMRPVFSEVEGSYQGYGGYKRWRDDLDQLADQRYEPEDFGDLGDHVLVTGTWHATGKLSGAPVQAPHVHLWTFRDGKPWRWEVYATKAEALEAAGLRE